MDGYRHGFWQGNWAALTVRATVCAAAAFALAGCGGGGSSTSPLPEARGFAAAPPGIVGLGFLPSAAGSSSGTIGSASGTALIVAASEALLASAPAGTLGSAALTFSVGGRAPAASVRAPLATHSGSAAGGSVVEARPSDTARLLEQTVRLQPLAAGGLANRIRSPQSVVAEGSTRSLWVEQLGAGATVYRALPVVLAKLTPHGAIWVDRSLTLESTAIDSIARDFENAFAADATHFGSSDYGANAAGLAHIYGVCDSTGNKIDGASSSEFIADPGTVDVIVANAMALGTVGGYFSAYNYLPQSIANCLGTPGDPSTIPQSNEAPTIVLGYDTTHSTAYELDEDLVRTSGHELEHLINFVNHVIVGGKRPEEPWIDEGLAMLAQDFAVQRLHPQLEGDVDDALYHARVYLDAPQNYSLTAFVGRDPAAAVPAFGSSGSYGAAYLFERYLYDRFGGDRYTRGMIASSSTGTTNLATTTGGSPGQIVADFAVALAAGAQPSSDPRFRFASLDMHGTYADQFGTSTTLDGPQPVAALTAGQSFGYRTPLGGCAYVEISGIGPAGVPVSVADPSGSFDLAVGVIPQ
ncbi:MAG: M30 family zinc metallopeptidase [Vulcanimicrobiaceae bacterium]